MNQPQIALIQDYYNYFKHLSENHPLILHSQNNQVFALMDLEEALGDFRSKIQEEGVVFRLFKYTSDVGDDSTHEVTKKAQAGFMIIDYFSNREEDQADYVLALNKTEQIVDDFIERIILDSQNGHPLFHNSLDSKQDFIIREAESNPSDGSYVGWMVFFDFSHLFKVCDDNTVGWLDGALTSFE